MILDPLSSGWNRSAVGRQKSAAWPPIRSCDQATQDRAVGCYVNWIDFCPPTTGQQLTRATEIAQAIAAQAPLGVQGTLANARAARAAAERAAIEQLRRILPSILQSEDATEGLRSFLDRRKGHFKGA